MPNFHKPMMILEFDRILQMLADAALTEGARKKALRLTPRFSRPFIEQMQRQTTEAKALAGAKGCPSFDGVTDIGDAVEQAIKGSSLSPLQLLHVAAVYRCASLLRDYYFNENHTEEESLTELFDGLQENRALVRDITHAIVSEELIADEASAELANIRRTMRAKNNQIREILQAYITSPHYSKFLQESIITIRDGRYVIPVRAEYKREVNGIVHDTSASGATLFVEPMRVVEANNELRVLQRKEEKEIERILAELSARVADHGDEAKSNNRMVSELAFIFSKAELSYRMNAVPAVFHEQRSVVLHQARHPLLDPKKVVPVDISLGTSFDTLVVTGPNTGGKTVTLKTLGLCCLMAQAGLHIPVREDSVLCVFDRIFADIGDEQSIEQSLSTFSGHMVNIVHFLPQVDARSLVLFDELGAGTDPVEGAALAIAILEDVRQKGALCAATTHYAELKAYALQTPGVCNASCEFDVESLRPTYRLIIGTPGKSNAFAISEKLGLSKDIITRAESYLHAENRQFEDVLTQLETQRSEMEQARREAQQLQKEYERSRAQADKTIEKELQQAQKTLRDAQEKAAQIVQSAKASSDYILEQMQQLQKQKDSDQLREHIAHTRQKVRLYLRENATDIDPVSERVAENYELPRMPVKGDQVILININKAGVVLSPPDKNGDVLVQAGPLKTKTNIKNLMLVDGKEVKLTEKKPRHVGNVQMAVRQNFHPEIDVRGQTGDDGWFMVDKYLDDAVMAHAKSITIIHGKGTGALRRALWNELKKDSRVKNFRAGTLGEGDAGVTVVELQ